MSAVERELWARVYAAVVNGLVANPNSTHKWSDIRDRATVEANMAVIQLREVEQ